MRQILLIFTFWEVCISECFAQSIFGYVINEQHTPVQHAYVFIMQQCDSMLIAKAMTDEKGFFEVESVKTEDLLLCVSSVNYETLYKDVTGGNCGNIIVKRKDITLDEVVVHGHSPMIVNNGTEEIINIKGSFLEKLGNLGDVLNFIPGIVSKGRGDYEVLGRGKPVFFVDGKEVTWQNIYNTIKSGNIKQIVIDREPGANYPIGTNAVINIITEKKLKDYISLDLYNSAEQKRKFSDNTSVDFRLKKGKYSTNVGYDYSLCRNMNEETYFTKIYHCNDIFRSDEANKNLMKTSSHIATWTNEYEISDKHSVSTSYYFSQTKDIDNNDEHISYTSSDMMNRDVMRNIDKNRNLHNFNLYYSGLLTKRSRLTVWADYAFINSKSVSQSRETKTCDGQSSLTTTSAKGNYKILALNTSYIFRMPYRIQTTIGGRFYKTTNPLDYKTNNPYYKNGITNFHQTISDEISAGYMSLSKNWEKVSAKVGGRYEYSYTKMTTKKDKSKDTSSTSSSIFRPYVQATYTPNKTWTFWIVLSRDASRQGYIGLSPLPIYRDSLTYNTGNQDLKPTVSDRFAMYVRWKQLTFSASYVDTKNSIKEVSYCQNQGTNILTVIPVNFPSSKEFITSISFYKNIGKITLNSAVYFSIPNCSYKFLNEECVVNKPNVNFNASIAYNPTRSFNIFTRLQYQGYQEFLNRKQKAANNWSVGLQKSFLADRLSVSLTATDILHKANYNNIKAAYINTQTGTYGTNDMRGVSLSMSYSLFRKDINVNSNFANQDVINRTK